MADKTIGSLPQAPVLTDDSSFVCEDSGVAKRVTGKQLKDFAKEGAAQAVEAAESAAERAEAATVNPPKIQNGTWWTFDQDTQAYVDSGQAAQGPVGATGADGKSAYASAQDGGFSGTEAEFNAALNDVPAHIASQSNPHKVTAAQVGLGNVDNVKQYSASNPPPYPVTSVNGQTGAVVVKPMCVTVTLTAEGWDSTAKTQTVTVTGVLADETKQFITPTPDLASQSAYYEAGIKCTGQAANSLTFTADNVPTADLTVYVVMQEVSA